MNFNGVTEHRIGSRHREKPPMHDRRRLLHQTEDIRFGGNRYFPVIKGEKNLYAPFVDNHQIQGKGDKEIQLYYIDTISYLI